MSKLTRALIEAIRKSDLSPRQKFFLRGLLLIPGFREAVTDYLAEILVDIHALSWADLIELIIEKLPEILAFIELLIGLFPEAQAAFALVFGGGPSAEEPNVFDRAVEERITVAEAARRNAAECGTVEA